MRFATIHTDDGTRTVKVDGDRLVDVGAADVGELLRMPGWRGTDGTGVTYDSDRVSFAPLVPNPSKVICVGHNYTNHIKEMGRDLPEYPTLFPKFADCLIGARDDIVKPEETHALDWEVELAIVIGAQVRRADEAQATAAIAGFTVMNDITARDWQTRTIEWTQGKIWDSVTPLGPYLVTPDEVGGVRPALTVRTTVDGRVMQEDSTATLLFDPVHLVQYISTVIRLNPGDIIATGTPAGVGHARDPQIHLMGGETITTEVEGIGACVNKITRA